MKEKGNSFFKEKKYKNAIECYSNGLQDDSLENNNKAILFLNRAVSYMNLYQQYQNEKFYADSMKDAEESFMWNPNYAKAYYIVAKLYLLKDDGNQALKNIQIATSIDPNQQDFIKLRDEIKTKKFDPFFFIDSLKNKSWECE